MIARALVNLNELATKTYLVISHPDSIIEGVKGGIKS